MINKTPQELEDEIIQLQKQRECLQTSNDFTDSAKKTFKEIYTKQIQDRQILLNKNRDVL